MSSQQPPYNWSPAPMYCDTAPRSTSTSPSSLPTLPLAHTEPSTSPFVVPSCLTTSAPLAKRPRKVSSKASLSAANNDWEEERPSKSSKPVRTPRPANAWICYRSARVQELKLTAEHRKLPQADISKIVGQLWRNETPEVRRQYEEMAERKKEEHKEAHPDYVFRPVRRKVSKRAAAKPKRASFPTVDVPYSGSSVLQPLPVVYSTPSPSATSLSADEGQEHHYALPTPSTSTADLPTPPSHFYPAPQPQPQPQPRVEQHWSPYSCALPVSYSYPPAPMYLPPSPTWTNQNFAAFSSFPSQSPLVDLHNAFSPTLQHGHNFQPTAYLTPPTTAAEPVFPNALYDQSWALSRFGPSDYGSLPPHYYYTQ